MVFTNMWGSNFFYTISILLPIVQIKDLEAMLESRFFLGGSWSRLTFIEGAGASNNPQKQLQALKEKIIIKNFGIPSFM